MQTLSQSIWLGGRGGGGGGGGVCMQMIYKLTRLEDENTSIPLQQGEVEDVYLSEENVNCDAFGRP